MFDSLAAAVGPDALLFSDDHRIVRVYGDVSRYLSLNDRSRLQFNASVLLPELGQEVRTLITVALKRGERRRGSVQRIGGNENDQVQLEAYPLKSPNLDEEFALITICSCPRGTPAPPCPPGHRRQRGRRARSRCWNTSLAPPARSCSRRSRNWRLRTRSLQATNEELQSSNEELQATNEELETSNEELQSTNEELVTVNEELQVSTTELTALTDEQDAVINSVASPVLVIDLALQVVKANDAALDLFQMRRALDRPHLSQVRVPDGFPHLAELCNESLHLGKLVSRNVISGGALYRMKCAPYSNQDGQLRGATMMFVEMQLPIGVEINPPDPDDREAVFYSQRRGDGTILSVGLVNARDLFGSEPDALIGSTIAEYLDRDSFERVQREDREFLESDCSPGCGDDSSVGSPWFKRVQGSASPPCWLRPAEKTTSKGWVWTPSSASPRRITSPIRSCASSPRPSQCRAPPSAPRTCATR